MNPERRKGRLRFVLSRIKAFLELYLHIKVTEAASCLAQAPSLDDKVNLHFIAFVNVGGHLFELGE